MSFGLNLSNEFKLLTKGIMKGVTKLDEVRLFTKLDDSFSALAKHYKDYRVSVIHGPTSFVAFDNTQSWVTKIPIKQKVVKELADMMLITYSPKKDICKLTYLQNKVGKNANKFSGDLMQLSLLKDRPVISPAKSGAKLSKYAFNPRILTDAVVPSVGSYGIFYRLKTGEYEMSYYPADLLEPNKAIGKSIIRSITYTGKINCSRNFGMINDSTGVGTLSEFGDALMGLKIGTPISRKLHDQLSLSLGEKNPTIDNEFTFMQISDDENNFNSEFEDNMNSFLGAATIVLINTDYKDDDERTNNRENY